MNSFDTIKIRRGPKADMPTLQPGELGFAFDTRELFVGHVGGNQLVASSDAAGGLFAVWRLSGQASAEQLPPGTLFEGADGQLHYKNLAGVVVDLTAPPVEPGGTPDE